MRFFNARDELLITQRKLPHWAQDGAVVFITWRTLDSIPKDVLSQWRGDRNRWLMAHDIDPTQQGWKTKVQELPAEEMIEFHDRFTTRWHEHLDAGHGACLLKNQELAEIVHDSLLHFDGDRYEMLSFVVMPNHVHLLATFPNRTAMLEQCDSWKHFTSREINRRTGTKGRFWQADAFDHLVRHEAQYQRLLSYISENPAKARLQSGESIVWAKPK